MQFRNFGQRMVWFVRNVIFLPSCRLAKGDSIACWQSWLVQFMPLSFQVAARPKVIQKHTDNQVFTLFGSISQINPQLNYVV